MLKSGSLRHVTSRHVTSRDTQFISVHDNRTPIGSKLPIMGGFIYIPEGQLWSYVKIIDTEKNLLVCCSSHTIYLNTSGCELSRTTLRWGKLTRMFPLSHYICPLEWEKNSGSYAANFSY